jgi:predicted anti-sigma-YlaC factor YlaD
MEMPVACSQAHLALSARRDGVAYDEAVLLRHLADCEECAAFERELARFSADWKGLAAPALAPDLWPRIEARLEPERQVLRRERRFALRAAAALLGFLAAYQAGPERPAPRPTRHLIARWLAPMRSESEARFEHTPEYRLLLSRFQSR